MPREALRPVRPKLDDDELMMVSGDCRMFEWGSPGDGSYDTVRPPVVMTGVANKEGAQIIAGAVVGAIGMNLLNKKRAQKDATTRWMDYAAGPITVSNHGFYVEESEGTWCWDYNAIEMIEWRGLSTIELRLSHQNSAGGTYQQRLVVTSDWAELIFVLWIDSCYPQHPGRLTWLDRGWLDRVRAALGVDPLTSAAAELAR